MSQGQQIQSERISIEELSSVINRFAAQLQGQWDDNENGTRLDSISGLRSEVRSMNEMDSNGMGVHDEGSGSAKFHT